MKVVSFYRFIQIDSPDRIRGRLQVLCEKEDLLGTILIAEEGVNGTLAGSTESVRSIFNWLNEALAVVAPIDGRWTDAEDAPFRRMRVKIKKEIVTLGRPDIRPDKVTGKHVDAKELGFDDVYQLNGGILKYLEDVDDADSRWEGECFVFDARVAVDRDRAEGGYVQCHACRRPLSTDDLNSPIYREGIACPKCVAMLDDERAARLEERRKQVQLARARGERHSGAT
jgi:predicted sulfurtransferase